MASIPGGDMDWTRLIQDYLNTGRTPSGREVGQPPVQPPVPYLSPPGTGAGTSNPFDLPQFGGPFAAPLLQGQMDALQGFNRMSNPGQPMLQSQDLLRSLNLALLGGPVYGPNAGQSLTEQLGNFTLPSTAQNTATQGTVGGLNTPKPTGTDLSGITSQMQRLLGNFQPGAGTAGVAPVTNTFSTALSTALSAPRFDTTEMFRTGEEVFRGDLDRSLAGIREEYSGLGLGPGSTDRNARLADEAGYQTARFRLGQQNLGMQAFESAENRRLGALSQAPGAVDILSLPGREAREDFSTVAGALPGFADIQTTGFEQGLANAQLGQNDTAQQMEWSRLLAGLEQLPFERYTRLGEPAADRMLNTLPFLFDLENLPFDRAVQQYGLNEAARGTAETEIQRRLEEYARTQGQGLAQIMSVLSGIPLNSIGYGPSTVSQIGNLLAGAGNLYSSIRGGGGAAQGPGTTPVGGPFQIPQRQPGLPNFG